MITAEQAIEIARRRAKELGWEMEEPLVATAQQTGIFKKRVVSYNIDEPQLCIGRRISFNISAITGKILEETNYGRRIKNVKPDAKPVE